MKSITIEFTPDGQAKIEAHGFEGKACEVPIAALEKELAMKNPKRVKKPEYNRHVRATQKAGR